MSKVSVFVDWENIAVSLNEQYRSVKWTEQQCLGEIVTRIRATYKEAIVTVFYSKFLREKGNLPSAIHACLAHEARILTKDITPEKNLVDTYIATAPLVSFFEKRDCDSCSIVIVSGDNDYIPILRAIRERGGSVAMWGLKESMATKLRDPSSLAGQGAVFLDDFLSFLSPESAVKNGAMAVQNVKRAIPTYKSGQSTDGRTRASDSRAPATQAGDKAASLPPVDGRAEPVFLTAVQPGTILSAKTIEISASVPAFEVKQTGGEGVLSTAWEGSEASMLDLDTLHVLIYGLTHFADTPLDPEWGDWQATTAFAVAKGYCFSPIHPTSGEAAYPQITVNFASPTVRELLCNWTALMERIRAETVEPGSTALLQSIKDKMFPNALSQAQKDRYYALDKRLIDRLTSVGIRLNVLVTSDTAQGDQPPRTMICLNEKHPYVMNPVRIQVPAEDIPPRLAANIDKLRLLVNSRGSAVAVAGVKNFPWHIGHVAIAIGAIKSEVSTDAHGRTAFLLVPASTTLGVGTGELTAAGST